MPKTLTEEALRDILPEGSWPQVEKWLDRGDGVAVYQNAALDSAGMGDRKFVSFGSPYALLTDAEPPTRLPDIGPQINWNFQLEATHRRH